MDEIEERLAKYDGRFAVLAIPLGVVAESLEIAEDLGWKFVGSLGVNSAATMVVFRREPK